MRRKRNPMQAFFDEDGLHDNGGFADLKAYAMGGFDGGAMRCLQSDTIGIFSPAAEWVDGDIVHIHTRSIVAPWPTGWIGRIYQLSAATLGIVADCPQYHARLFRRPDVVGIAPLVQIRLRLIRGHDARNLYLSRQEREAAGAFVPNALPHRHWLEGEKRFDSFTAAKALMTKVQWRASRSNPTAE